MSINPGFMMGSNGLRVGFDFGVSMRIGDMNVSVGYGLYDNASAFGSGLQGAELRRSIMFSHGNYAFGLNDFQSGTTTQTTWMAGWSDGRWSVFTENDMALFGSGHQDRHRTAALEIGYNNGHGTIYTAGFKLYTSITDREKVKNNIYTDKEALWKHLACIAYGGVRVKWTPLSRPKFKKIKV